MQPSVRTQHSASGPKRSSSIAAPPAQAQSRPCATHLQQHVSVARGSVATCSHRASSPSTARSARTAHLAYGESLVSKLVTGTRGVDVELFGLSSADCRRLTTSLKQAKSWQDLSMQLPCTPAEWTGVDTVCLTAAFSSLARVTARGPGGSHRASLAADPISRAEIGACLRLVTQLALPRLAQFDAQGLVTMAVSLAKMQEYYGAPAETAASPQAPAAAAPSASGPVPPAGTGAPSAASGPLALPSTSTSAVSASSPFSSAPAPASPAPPLPDLIDLLLTHSRNLMPRFQPQSLANLIWALATLGHPPGGAWLTEYYRRLESQLGSLGPRDVCNILWSLCKLDLMPDVWLRDGLVERCLQAVREQQHYAAAPAPGTSTQGQAPSGSGTTRLLTPGAIVAQAQHLLPGGQDRATLIQCLARWYYNYNYRVPDEWLSQYLSLVLPAMGQYSAFDLVSVVHSCVVMNYQPSRRWMAGYCVFVLRSLKYDSTLSFGDLQRLMWAMSRIDYTPPLTWQREFVAATVPKLRHLNVRALAEMVWAFSCWGCRPSPEWLAAYFNASGPRLADAQPQHISCQLSALAKLDVRAPGPWLDQALDSFVDQLADAKAHDLVTLLDTITVLCMDRTWILQRTDTIKRLADTAASKFAVYDALMHTKLCLALAAANVCPAADWWKKQQAALAACLRGGDAHSQVAAQGLREVYRAWDVEVDTELKPYL